MRTRRDQVQAYRFVLRRIVAALLSSEPESPEQPMRRLGLTLVASTMLAAVILAAVGVYGLVTNQSAPLEENTLVIERETHARYVYMNGRLHPVLNYASARLVLGAAQPAERTMSRAALEDLVRGPTVGIPGAPDGLPEADALMDLPWRVCSVPPGGDSPNPTTAVVLGRELTGGSALGDRGLYVAVGRSEYLLWNDSRLRIAEPVALYGLGLSAVEPVAVGEQLVNAVTSGPDLKVVLPAGFGEPVDVDVDGQESLVGFIYRAADQHYVMTRDGLVPVGDLTVALRQGAASVRVRDITGGQASRALASNRPLEPEGFPLTAPQMHPATGAAPTVCATYRAPTEGGALATTVEVFDSTPAELAPGAPDTVRVAQSGRDVVATVDRVLIAGGQGALLRSVPTADADTAESTTYLVTAQGMKYPLGLQSGDARVALGYGDVSPVTLPAALVDLIPTGPTLDVAGARLPADPATGAQDGGVSGAGG